MSKYNMMMITDLTKKTQIWLILILLTSLSFADSPINFDALYPWNLGSSAYYTYGEYSTGKSYRSYAGYISMDRRWRDRFAISYEDLKTTIDSTEYRQYNVLGRDFFWIKKEFRIGGIVGFFNSNTLEQTYQDSLVADSLLMDQRGMQQDVKYASTTHYSKQHLNGWIAGTQITGDLKWFGYAFSYIHSEYFTIDHRTDIYDYDEWFLENWVLFNDTTYYYDDVSEIFVNQYTGIVGKKFGDQIMRIGGMIQQINDEYLYSALGAWIWQPIESFTLSASASFGKSRYSVDPYALLINNNPDVLLDLSSINLIYRINANWNVIGVYSFHRYETIKENSPYHSNFYTIGIQGRF